MPVVQEIVRGLVWFVVLVVTFVVGLVAFGVWHDEWSGYNASVSVGDGICNIAVIPVYGEMVTYPYTDESGVTYGDAVLGDIEYWLKGAEHDPTIDGVLLVVDSPGGSPYAGEALANALQRSALPSAVVVQDVAASAAYWMATGADTIIASPLSTVGSIGVTMSYLERTVQNSDNGLSYIEIASGPYKDSGNPDKYLTETEREIFQKDVDTMHQEFVKQVAENRDLTVEHVSTFSDGSTLLGEAALSAGFIDAVGDKETARAWFAEKLEMSLDDVILCE